MILSQIIVEHHLEFENNKVEENLIRFITFSQKKSNNFNKTSHLISSLTMLSIELVHILKIKKNSRLFFTFIFIVASKYLRLILTNKNLFSSSHLYLVVISFVKGLVSTANWYMTMLDWYEYTCMSYLKSSSTLFFQNSCSEV
jgi:hypothetical protein